jgi:hypothetical protein
MLIPSKRRVDPTSPLAIDDRWSRRRDGLRLKQTQKEAAQRLRRKRHAYSIAPVAKP